MRLSPVIALSGAFLAFTSSARAEDPPRPDYVLVADPELGMEGGVRTGGSLGRILFRYEDVLPKVVDVDETKTSGKLVGVVGRSLKWLFVDTPLAELETTVVHEVFGHGARGRELGQRPNYRFTLPAIYCTILSPRDDQCGGSASVNVATGFRDRDIAIVLGGVESNYLQAWWINQQLMQTNGFVHHGELLVYVAAKTPYLGTFFDADLKTGGAVSNAGSNDIAGYVTMLQDRFNRWRPRDRASVAGKLQTAYLWNFADPTLFFALYSTFANSLYRGERTSRVPLPSAFGTTFYPVPRFNLSPFGAEHYLDVFFGRRGAVLDLYGRVGSSGLAAYFGGGARMLGWRPVERLGLGGELDVWTQPEMLVDERAVYVRPNRLGANVGTFVDLSVVDRLGVTLKLAYKSAGYLMGQPLDDGLYGYAGITIKP